VPAVGDQTYSLRYQASLLDLLFVSTFLLNCAATPLSERICSYWRMAPRLERSARWGFFTCLKSPSAELWEGNGDLRFIDCDTFQSVWERAQANPKGPEARELSMAEGWVVGNILLNPAAKASADEKKKQVSNCPLRNMSRKVRSMSSIDEDTCTVSGTSSSDDDSETPADRSPLDENMSASGHRHQGHDSTAQEDGSRSSRGRKAWRTVGWGRLRRSHSEGGGRKVNVECIRSRSL